MTRSAARPVAGALFACTFAAGLVALAPAQAAPRAGYYQATLAAALAEPRKEVLDGVVWNCAGDSCAGTRGGSRPVIVCGRLAHKVGEIASFTVAGDALAAEDLAACNK
jgi:hypothetical protein